MSQVTKTIVTIIVTAIIVGSTVYWWQKQKQPTVIQNQNTTTIPTNTDSSLKNTTPSSTPSSTAPSTQKQKSFSEMVKTYTNEQYGFSFKYPESWRLGENYKYPYVAGNWDAESKGMTISLCLPPDGCQDAVIRISVVEKGNLKNIIKKESEGSANIKTNRYQTIIDFDYGKEKHRSIITQDDNGNVFIISGPTTVGRTESTIFDELFKSFTIFNLH